MKGRRHHLAVASSFLITLGFSLTAFGGDPAPVITRTTAPQLAAGARAHLRAASGPVHADRRVPAQAVPTNPNFYGQGVDVGGYGAGTGVLGNYGGNYAGNGLTGFGAGAAYGNIARVAVAPVGFGIGGLRYVTRPTFTLYSQSVARGFFTAAGVNMGGGVGLFP